LIKRRLNQKDHQRAVALGRKLWDREVARFLLPPGFPRGKDLLLKLSEAVPATARSLEDFFALVGRGKVVLNRKIVEKVSPPGLQSRRKGESDDPAEIQVKDRGRELVRLAKCCAPIQGEPIVGYLTTGKGITVHAGRCPWIVKELLSPDRLIEVGWGELTPVFSRAGILVTAQDSPGLLAKVAEAVSRLEGDITKAEVMTFADRRGQIRMTLKIRDIRHLENICREIGLIEGVVSVDRA
jgi:GTP pyrophosphokinase